MSSAIRSIYSSPKLLLNLIGSRYALSNQALILFAIPVAMVGLIFDPGQSQRPLTLHLLFTVVGYVAVVIPLLIARKFLPDAPRKSRPIAILLVFLVAGIIRGLSLIAVGEATVGIADAEVSYRFFGAPSFTVVTMSLAAILSANDRLYKESLQRLSDERQQLQLSSLGESAKVQLQREELLSKVEAILDPALRKIQQTLHESDNNTKDAVSSLTATVDYVIRPLTKEVAETRDEIQAVMPLTTLREKAPLPSRISLGEFLPAPLGSLFIAANVLPVSLWVDPAQISWSIFALSILLVNLIVGSISKLTKQVMLTPVITGIVVPSIFALSLLPFLWIVPAIGSNFTTDQVIFFMIVGGSITAALFYAQLIQFQRELTLEKLAAVNLELQKLNAAIRQELWLNRRRLASILHGPIQAALYSAAMKLAQADKPSGALIAEVEADIEQALDQLSPDSKLNIESTKAELADLVEFWEGSCNIVLDADEALLRKVNQEPAAAEALIEIAREFVNNAIKHGKASKIDLAVKEKDGKVAISCLDDGQLSESNKPGFGSSLLSELAFTWSRTRTGNTTLAYAEIVLGRDNL